MKYAELHCLTNFSFLQAASHPDELIARAAALKYAALAVTDRHSVAGMARAYTATKDHPVPLIVGAEIRPVDAEPVVLWATSRRGYASLCSLITTGCRRAPKGECRLTIDDVSRNATELIAGVLPPMDQEQFAAGDARLYREIFGHACYLQMCIRDRSDIEQQQQAAIEGSKTDKKIEPIRNRGEQVKRNDPCPCGSGKKYKNCCLKNRGRNIA